VALKALVNKAVFNAQRLLP